MTIKELELIKENYYITTCGRIFSKHSPYRTIKSFEIIPSLQTTFNNFISRNNLKKEDFIRIKTGLRNTSNKVLYLYKYKEETLPFIEIFGGIDSDGYNIVSLSNKSYRMHRIIKLFFENIEKIENFNNLQINHIDGNKQNNCSNNLEWCSSKENIKHAWDNNLSIKTREQNLKSSKTKLKKYDINVLFLETTKETKMSMLKKLQRRNINIDDYVFISTGSKSNRRVGYLKILIK